MEKPVAGPSKDPDDAGREDPSTEPKNQRSQFYERSTLTRTINKLKNYLNFSQERGDDDDEITYPGKKCQEMLRAAECLVKDLHGAGLMTAECATIMKPVMHEMLSTVEDLREQLLTALDETILLKTRYDASEKEKIKLRKELKKLRRGAADRLSSTLPEKT
jgi:hypothetical protein